MTDNPYWQPPASPNPQPAQPQFGRPEAAAPQYGAPQAGAPQYGAPQYGTPPGWTPPPKPGLIPLRPLSFGTILGSSFRVMRRNPAPTFGLSVLLYGFITIVFAAVFGGLLAFSIGRLSTASSSDVDEILAGSVALIALSALVPIGLAVVATGMLQGIISLEVSRATLGEKLKIRGLWRLAKGRMGALVGYTLALSAVALVLVTVGAFIAFGAFALTGSAATAGSPEGIVGAILGSLAVSFIIIALFGVAGAYFGTKLAFVPTVLLLERLTIGGAIKRSWQLTKGNFWRTLGTQLLIGVIINVASQLIATPVGFVVGIAGSLINPTTDVGTYAMVVIVSYLVLGILTTIVGAVGLVMQSSAYSLIYIDIRMRREGLDLELMRYVEAKTAGTTGVENPYLVDRSPAAAPPPATAGSPWA